MKRQMRPIDPNHQNKRRFLRIVGVSILAVGIFLLIVGMVDFFSAAGSFGGPKYFWINFIALPLIFAGASMTSAGYMGAMARYSAEEMAPVSSETFNYVAEETKEGVETFARAIKEGLENDKTVLCSNCRKANPVGSAFCNGCGSPVNQEKTCSKCGLKNPHDSSFCNGCGTKLDT